MKYTEEIFNILSITTLLARNRKSIWNVNWKQFRSGLIT